MVGKPLITSFMHGMPPHIAQLVAGHRDINVTLGYKAVYPDEAIQAHLAFLARRRALRPSEEYRAPTDQEWTEFLGHFERRKVATGTCGRAFGTPCIHEHAPLTELTSIFRQFMARFRSRTLACPRDRIERGTGTRSVPARGVAGGPSRGHRRCP